MPNAAFLWEKFQQQEGAVPRAVRKFTDRQDFRLAYYSLVSRALEENFQDCYIMNYYGIGGVGKSALLRRLETELLGDEALPEDEARAACEAARGQLRKLSRKQKPVVLQADFDDPTLKTLEDVLLRFRAQVMRQYDKAMFPLFDVAMLRLSQKYGRRLPPDEQKELLSDNPVISFALDVVGDFTGTGLLIGAAQTAAKVGQSVAYTLAGRKNAIKKANSEASRMDVPELERRLPYYFAMDVNAMGLPLVCIYLDTYEKMTARAEGAGRSTGFDEDWLQGDHGLVRNLGNAVFAIAGREQLTWTGLPFENRYIKALSEADSVNFLASCGVEDAALRARLYQLTEGEPIYLDLCVDEYEHLTAAGKEHLTLEDFGGSLDRLVERHTRYVSQNLRDALYLLAAMGHWTDDICKELAQTLPIPYPAGTEYDQLTHLSYVRKEGEESWSMHRPVAQVLAKNLNGDLWERLIAALLNLMGRKPAVLDILEELFEAAPDCRTARAIEQQAQTDCGAGRYPEARKWQEKAAALWKSLSSEHPAQYGASLAALADIRWTQLKNQPASSEPEEESAEQGEGPAEAAPKRRKEWQELRDVCVEAIKTCEELGTGLEEPLARLWERRANAEDMLADWDAAISSWEQVLEVSRGLDRPETVLLNARLQMGWDNNLAGRLEEACAVLEDTLKRLVALGQGTFSAKALLAAEVLCQSYDGLMLKTASPWSERLAKVQKELRSLDYTVKKGKSLEELLDWQDWMEASLSSFWFHSGMGKEGADALERLQRAAGLERQVISGLKEHLDELHPTVLNARKTLVNICVNQESARGTSSVITEDYLIQSLVDGQQPVGSVPKRNDCFLLEPETVIADCQELVELYTAAMGREYPGTYEAKEQLAHIYQLAARPEEAILLRQELWQDYSRIYGENSREALRQNGLLIENTCLAGRWEEAIALQTRRLERASETSDLPEEREKLCTLYLSRLWQEEDLPQDQAQKCLTGLLPLTKAIRPFDRRNYLDSAWQWYLEYTETGLEETAVDVSLALAETFSVGYEYEVIDLLAPWAEDHTLSVRQRCAVLLQLGKAYRGKKQSVELLDELADLLESHPEVETPDRGTALLELGLSLRRLAAGAIGDSFQQNARKMLEALRGAVAWREEHLSPEDPAVNDARFELASALVWVGKQQEAVPLLEAVLAFRRKAEDAGETVKAELMLVQALARMEGRHDEALARFRQVQRSIKELRLPLFTAPAQYALYRGAGGTLSFMEWQEAGEPEQD